MAKYIWRLSDSGYYWVHMDFGTRYHIQSIKVAWYLIEPESRRRIIEENRDVWTEEIESREEYLKGIGAL